MRSNPDYELFTNNDCSPTAFWKQAKDIENIKIPENIDQKDYKLNVSDINTKRYAFASQVLTMLNVSSF